MPFNIIKESIEYCTVNYLFFLFVLIVLFLCHLVLGLLGSEFIESLVINVLMAGYGLNVAQDIINGGKRLPKLMPKQIIVYGVKASIIFLFYVAIQTSIMLFVCGFLSFPTLELKEFFLNHSELLQLLSSHDEVIFVIFVLSSLIVLYVTTFFFEISLARCADGGSLKSAFNFPRIKHVIDVIGWRDYALEYTKLILSIVILTLAMRFIIPVPILDSIIDSILNFLMFVIQYMGIGVIYKVYKDSKYIPS